MRIKKKTLKSWNKEEIKHLKKTLKSVKKRGTNSDFEHAVYWMITLVAIIAGLVAAAAISTAGIIIPSYWLALIAAIGGLGLGNVFSAALHELDHLKKEHHLFFSSIVIITNIVSFILVSKLPFFYELSAEFGVKQTPAIVGASYVIFFLIPYYFRLLEEKYERLGHPLH